MEDLARRISVQTEGTSNVLTVELQENETLIPYCCKIMEGNSIPGLLRMRHGTLDGVVSLRYNIGGKVRLHEFMVQHHLTYQNGVLLLRNLSNALLHLDEYFLSIDMCYLDPEHIYVGDGLQTYLPCIPVQQKVAQNSATRLKHFYEKLLSEYFATADCNSYDDMFKWVYKATLFDLKTFYNQFLKEEKVTAQVSSKQPVKNQGSVEPSHKPLEQAMGKQMTDKVSDNKAHELTEMLQGKMKGVQALYPGATEEPDRQRLFNVKSAEESGDASESSRQSGAFRVPGADSFEIPGVQKKAERTQSKPAPVKKGFKLFGSRSEKATEQTKKTVEMPFQVPRSDSSGIQQPKYDKKKEKETPHVPKEETWEDGTILVGQGKDRPQPQQSAQQPMKAYFLHNGQKVPITETPFLVGKYNTTCHLHYAIYDNNKVSRSHATFLFENGQFFIRDNQSRNGTSLNGQSLLPLQPASLKDGDEIKLYDEVLIFHVE